MDPFPAELLDREDGDIVAWHESECRDDDATDCDLEQTVPRCSILAVKADLLQYDVLVQVDAVEPVES